jgi:alpha-mannosidase
LINLAADNLVLTAFKPSEDHPDRWVLRCYEAHGQTTPLPWADHSGLVFSSFLDPALVEKADLLEQPLQTDSQADDATHIDRLTPWQIATFVFPTLS